jgi:hypothetical protein
MPIPRRLCPQAPIVLIVKRNEEQKTPGPFTGYHSRLGLIFGYSVDPQVAGLRDGSPGLPHIPGLLPFLRWRRAVERRNPTRRFTFTPSGNFS